MKTLQERLAMMPKEEKAKRMFLMKKKQDLKTKRKSVKEMTRSERLALKAFKKVQERKKRNENL